MTRALILAAGQGTRLRPITDNIPKCLVSLQGAPLLEHQAVALRSEGIERIAVATGYRGDQIEALGYEVFPNQNYAITNMVTSLFCARDFLRDEEDLLISYGDIVYSRKNLRTVLESDAQISLMIDSNWRDLWSVRLENPLDDAETLLLDKDNRVKELGKKPTGYHQIQGQYTGLIKVRADTVSQLQTFYRGLDPTASYDGQDLENMYMTSFLQLLIDAGLDVRAAIVTAGWLEIDSCDDLETYESMAKSGELDRFWKANC